MLGWSLLSFLALQMQLCNFTGKTWFARTIYKFKKSQHCFLFVCLFVCFFQMIGKFSSKDEQNKEHSKLLPQTLIPPPPEKRKKKLQIPFWTLISYILNITWLRYFFNSSIFCCHRKSGKKTLYLQCGVRKRHSFIPHDVHQGLDKQTHSLWVQVLHLYS